LKGDIVSNQKDFEAARKVLSEAVRSKEDAIARCKADIASLLHIFKILEELEKKVIHVPKKSRSRESRSSREPT
jgi:peptidoglycan hydrolase CwlO-like protein